MSSSIPVQALNVLLQDAIQRDRTTARRMALLTLLLNERYLTRDQLMIRVEGLLGVESFGSKAMEDVFYRDMRVVKEALNAAGFILKYSRSQKRNGYYLEGEPPISVALANLIHGALQEVDLQQMEIFRKMTPAGRFQLGCSVTNAACSAVAYRMRNFHPELTPTQAHYMAIQGKLPK